MATNTEFWLNDRHIKTTVSPGMLVLDFLRKEKRLVGTKEGCKEGDCGACAILIGEVVEGKMKYMPVTSCLVPVGEMQGKHVVSIEGLNARDPKELSPVQDAFVNHGASQCGFCTPGFIVSLSWYMMDERNPPTREGMKRAISGNLCRCTGYGSIVRAADDLVNAFGKGGQWHSIWQAEDRIESLVGAGMLPAYFSDMPAKLTAINKPDIDLSPSPENADFFVAGGTDLYVQKGEHIPNSTVKILNHHPEMKGIRLVDGKLRVGALTTFEEFGANVHIRKIMPRIDHYLFLIASLHLRNRATLSGNIINASPIGDMSNLLLALDTELVFADGDTTRIVPMKEFFLGYKVYDKKPSEIMTEIVFPMPEDGTLIHFEKVSKRISLDIATVNSAIKISLDSNDFIQSVNITLGGVAAVPFWLKDTTEFLVGKSLSAEIVQQALDIAQQEISPISDVRGSADYKRLLARQLMTAHFLELFPHKLRFEDVA